MVKANDCPAVGTPVFSVALSKIYDVNKKINLSEPLCTHLYMEHYDVHLLVLSNTFKGINVYFKL